MRLILYSVGDSSEVLLSVGAPNVVLVAWHVKSAKESVVLKM